MLRAIAWSCSAAPLTAMGQTTCSPWTWRPGSGRRSPRPDRRHRRASAIPPSSTPPAVAWWSSPATTPGPFSATSGRSTSPAPRRGPRSRPRGPRRVRASPGVDGNAVAYVPVRGRLLNVGGWGASSDETWAVNLSGGPVWTTLVDPGQPPQQRTDHVAIYDGARHRAILYGGTASGWALDDAWVFQTNGAP